MSGSAPQDAPVDFSKTIDRSVLSGQTAIITGGASGIGYAIATQIAASGGSVTLVDVNDVQGFKAADSLTSSGYKANFIKADVTDWDQLLAAFETVVKSSPTSSIDIVVTAAGVTTTLATLPPLSTQSAPVKPPIRTVDINFNGTYNCVYLAMWYFTQSSPERPKQILLVSSLAAYSYYGNELAIDYIASKFGVRGMFIQLRKLIHGYGNARINMLAPTLIETPLLLPGAADKARAGGLKLATLDDATDGALRCLCDSTVNGRAIVIVSSDGKGAGAGNFDPCDDLPDQLGGKVLLEKAMAGAFGKIPGALGGRLTQIEDFAPLVTFLVTQGGWINCQTIFANGGFTAR